MAEITVGDVSFVDLSPRDEECCICDCTFSMPYWQPSYGIPMYEGMAVPPEWDGEWGGFFACKPCFGKYENGELRMWTIEQLRISTTPSTAPGTSGEG